MITFHYSFDYVLMLLIPLLLYETVAEVAGHLLFYWRILVKTTSRCVSWDYFYGEVDYLV